jgi:hypothetical protein
MNKRIKELAEQARLGRGPEKIQIRENGVVIFYLDELEKFAELIVRECMRVVEDYYMDPCSYADEAIKEHFGVEE